MGRLQKAMEEAIAALTRLDAGALEGLRSEIQELTAVSNSPEDVVAILQSHRLLGALLHETARNLRVFRAAAGRQTSELGCYALRPR